ncbi:MAG: hypothetical protein IJ874_00485 [Ruminococcus sp.]|nr:hypothetical protein [Ruminococcus sp.]
MTVHGEFISILFAFVFAVPIPVLLAIAALKSSSGGVLTGNDKLTMLLCLVPGVLFISLAADLKLSYMATPGDLALMIGLTMPFGWLPSVLAVMSLRKLISNNNTGKGSDIFTILLGAVYSAALVGSIFELSGADYDEAIYYFQKHAILHTEYGYLIFIFTALGIAGLIVLVSAEPGHITPIVSAVSTGFTIVGLVLMAFINIQLMREPEYGLILLWLYYAVLIFITARAVRFHITEQVRLNNEREAVFRTRVGKWLHRIMSSAAGMTAFTFAMILPVAALLEILYILTGQGVSGFIKAFTETADWTFSQQTPPPPLEYDGHYLCTVAAGGHKKIVRPLRYGKRLDHIIIVNRQLLAANAFEELIAEKAPGFHRAVRSFYNRHGYPVSKLITTQLRADVVYILMKPLEWLFILTLYLFDTNPEDRIAVQYSDHIVQKRRNINAQKEKGNRKESSCIQA